MSSGCGCKEVYRFDSKQVNLLTESTQQLALKLVN